MKKKRVLALALAGLMMISQAGAGEAFTMQVQAEESTAIEENKEGYYYLFEQCEDQMLPTEEKYLTNELLYWDAKAEEEISIPIKEIQIVQQYIWGEDGEQLPAKEEIFSLEGNSADGWNLFAEDYGLCDIKLIFEKDGEEKFLIYTVYSSNAIYRIEYEYPDDTAGMVRNFKREISSTLWKNYRDDESGCNIYDEKVTGYELEIHGLEDEELIKTSLSTDKKTVEIQSGDQEGYAFVDVSAYLLNDGEKVEVSRYGIDVAVKNEFYNILPFSFEVSELYEEVDLSGVGIYRYNAESPTGTLLTSDIRLNVQDYDSEVWKPNGEITEGTIPKFTRISQKEGSIWICAQQYADGEWKDLTNRGFWFPELEYNVWFEDLQNGDTGYIYADGENIFHINTDQLKDKTNYTLNVELGIFKEDETFQPFEDQTGLFDLLKDDGRITGIQIHASALEKYRENLRDGEWLNIHLTVSVGDQILQEECPGVALRSVTPEYMYREYGVSLLPFWDYGIDERLDYYLENEEYPYGFEGTTVYTDLKLEVTEGEEDAITAEKTENGWSLYANGYGTAVVTLYHPDVLDPEKSIAHSFEVWSTTDVWSIDFVSDTGTNDICPGGTQKLTANITHDCYQEDLGHFSGDTEKVVYEWGYPDWADQGILDYDTEGHVLNMTVKETAEYDRETCLYLRVYQADDNGKILKDEDGNDIEVAYDEYQVNVREAFFTLQPFDFSETPDMGESFTVTPKLLYISETENREYTEDVVYEWEWDPENVEIKDENGNVLTPDDLTGRSGYGTGTYTMKRLKNDGTELWLRAYIREGGEYQEVFARYFWLDHVDYGVWFEKDRGGEGDVWVFSDETEYSMTLNTDSLRDEKGELREGISLEYFIGVTDDDGTVIQTLKEDDGYRLEGDRLILNGKKLAEGGFEEFGVNVTVTVNGIKMEEFSYTVWVSVNEPEFFIEDGTYEITLSKEAWWIYQPDETLVIWIRDAEHPEGEEVEFEVRNIRTETTDQLKDQQGDVFRVVYHEDGVCEIFTDRYGTGEIIYTIYEEEFGELEVRAEHQVVSDIYLLNVTTETHYEEMLPNSELSLIWTVRQVSADDDGTLVVSRLDAESFEMSYEYDKDLIAVDSEGKITSFEKYGSAWLKVNATIKNAEDGQEHTCSYEMMISITDECMVFTAEKCSAVPGGKLFIDDLGIRMFKKTVKNPEGKEVTPEEITFLETDWYEVSEDGKSIELSKDLENEELPTEVMVYYGAFFQDTEYGNWTKITVRESVTKVFYDVEEGKWYVDAVQYVYDHDLMTGFAGYFTPEANMTRAMVVTTLYRMAGSPEVTDYGQYLTFIDVHTNDWYQDAVAWALNEGVATGDPVNHKFNPNTNVTREQLAAFLCRYTKDIKGGSVEAVGDLSSMKNAEKVSDWALKEMKWAVGEGLIGGLAEVNSAGEIVGYDLAPQGNATRAQMATILMRYNDRK